MSDVIVFLKHQCEYWRKMIPLMQSGAIRTVEGGTDITDETVSYYMNQLREAEALLAEHESQHA